MAAYGSKGKVALHEDWQVKLLAAVCRFQHGLLKVSYISTKERGAVWAEMFQPMRFVDYSPLEARRLAGHGYGGVEHAHRRKECQHRIHMGSADT